MSRIGADATGTTVAALRALGATFVSRYLSDYPAKSLTLDEARTLTAAGIDIVSNWENDVNDWATGQGRAFARRAAQQHKACGGPEWAPIYFSVDEKVDPSDPRLHNYFADINAEIGFARTGCYAQTSVLRALRSAGLIRFTWRSMSTFGLPEGLGNPGEFDVEQTGQFNPDYDRDVANSAFFGQWRIGAAQPEGALVILDQASIDAIAQAVHDSILNHQLGDIGQSGTTTVGVDVASDPARWVSLYTKIDALSAAVAKLTATQATDLTQLQSITAEVGQIQAPQVSQDALNAAVKAALLDPAVLKAIAHAGAVELHDDTPAS